MVLCINVCKFREFLTENNFAWFGLDFFNALRKSVPPKKYAKPYFPNMQIKCSKLMHWQCLKLSQLRKALTKKYCRVEVYPPFVYTSKPSKY